MLIILFLSGILTSTIAKLLTFNDLHESLRSFKWLDIGCKSMHLDISSAFLFFYYGKKSSLVGVKNV